MKDGKIIMRIKMIWRRFVISPIRERRKQKGQITEKIVSYGKQNADKIFFVIRRNGPTVGLFSFLCTNLGWIKYALENGFIPVIDMQNLPNVYLEDKEIKRVNAWEYYFRQPCGYSLKDIKNSKNVILSSGGAPKEYPSMDMYKNGDLDLWYELYQRYIIPLPDIATDIAEGAKKLKDEYGKVLGVNIRGTDYTELRPTGHPIQPTIDEAIDVTREKMKEWECNVIFLATEDEYIAERFVAEFNGKVILPDGVRYDYRNDHLKYVTQNGYNREKDRFLRGREYLVKIGILSQLDYIVSSFMGSTYGMMLMNKEHKKEFYWDLGTYE